ncbi:hypothetical protein DY000_02049657 [Brassica cretica]|uniref:USP domain-containing protein n=1 Tax=Brassica cretica TaxID=69181 RepID=A0ABQ7ET74_BRACR|nr:hypothetical protein DY000_02049657 [Brassica cretica]
MGVAGSKLEKALGEQFPEGERYFGFENFGNTCYCNSVLQLLEYYTNNKSEENLLTCLADLFSQISSQKKKTGVIAPKRFVQRLKKQNVLFQSYMHQDAHEFLNYLLNELDDILEKEAKTDNETSSSPGKISNGPKLLQANGVHKEPTVTWVHKIFQPISTFLDLEETPLGIFSSEHFGIGTCKPVWRAYSHHSQYLHIQMLFKISTLRPSTTGPVTAGGLTKGWVRVPSSSELTGSGGISIPRIGAPVT